MKLVIAGVSGSGKSTIGKHVAGILGADFLDADAYHPPENILKMSRGIPLEDKDREGWIQTLGQELARREKVVLACSALKLAYRDHLRKWAPDALFALLVLNKTELGERIAGRANSGHFMPSSLLDSQLSTLEAGLDMNQFENRRPPEEVARRIIETLKLQ